MFFTLTAIRSCLLLLALAALLYAGKQPHVRRGTGWLFVTIGFGIVAAGSLIQMGAFMPSLHAYTLFADPGINRIVAEVCGFYLGICFVFIGMWQLGPILYKFYFSEKQLVESQRNFRAIVDTSLEGIVVVRDDLIVFANPSAEAMLGIGQKELIGARAMDFIVPMDRDRVYARRDAILANKDKDINEYRLLARDGQTRTALISSQYIDWEDQDAFLSIILDITELKQVEENLAAIANTASEAIGIFQDEHMVYCNPAMISTFGYTFKELQARPFYEFVHPEDRPKLIDRYAARQAGNEVGTQYDYRLLGKDGMIFWVMISAGLTQWKGEVATVTILTNVTARKNAEEDLRQAKEDLEIRVEERTKDLRAINEQLAAISNQKSAFVSAASHELRTPLASILGFSALVGKILDKHVAPAVEDDQTLAAKVRQARDNIDIIKKEGGRLTRLLDDMLDVSKIEAGQAEWRDEPLAVPDVVDAAVATARIHLDTKPGVVLRVEHDAPVQAHPGGPRPHHAGGHQSFGQRDQVHGPGEIAILSREARKGVLELRVTDSGTGMTERERGLVFQKYYQAESRSKGISKAPKGTGLGLAICKEIVEHYGGSIGVEAGSDGAGSSFYVRLPLLVD